MSAKSLFNVVLKVFGISFIKDILISLPAFLSVFYSLGDGDASGAISTLLITSLTLLVYCVVAYYFVFRTQQVMARLRLLENIPEDPIPLNIHRSTIVSIAILLIALYVITEAIPLLIRGLAKWYQYNRMTKGLLNAMEPFDYSMILVYAAEIVIGLLLFGYHRQLVNFIELKTRRKSS
jgi:Ca2+/Na+ antiporter